MKRIGSSTSPARDVFGWTIATLVLTSVHHVYGGLRYATAWRIHGAVVALGLVGFLYALRPVYRRDPAGRPGRVARWSLLAIAVFVVLAIGVFEGAYNHVAKDALFLAGAPRHLLLRMFPPPMYELPNDAFFEVTGVAQVIPAALAAIASIRFLGTLLGRGSGTPRTGLARQG